MQDEMSNLNVSVFSDGFYYVIIQTPTVLNSQHMQWAFYGNRAEDFLKVCDAVN